MLCHDTQHKNALDKYYQNPKLCKFCNLVIHPLANEAPRKARLKTFCSTKCAYTHRRKPPATKQKLIRKERFTRTKGELYECYSWTSARTIIQKCARIIFNAVHKSHLPCAVCGYNKHTDIAHIKAVKDFSDDTPIYTINHIQNLTCLCPNCHWEFDHGLLKSSAVRICT